MHNVDPYIVKFEDVGVGACPGAELFSKCHHLSPISDPNDMHPVSLSNPGNIVVSSDMLRLFTDKPVKAFSGYFQEQIDVLVSWVLSNLLPDKLDDWELEPSIIQERFVRAIPKSNSKDSLTNETQVHSTQQEVNDVEVPIELNEPLLKLVESLVRHFSVYISSLLDAVYGEQKHALRHRIVTSKQLSERERFLIIVSLPKNPDRFKLEIEHENRVTITPRGFQLIE